MIWVTLYSVPGWPASDVDLAACFRQASLKKKKKEPSQNSHLQGFSQPYDLTVWVMLSSVPARPACGVNLVVLQTRQLVKQQKQQLKKKHTKKLREFTLVGLLPWLGDLSRIVLCSWMACLLCGFGCASSGQPAAKKLSDKSRICMASLHCVSWGGSWGWFAEWRLRHTDHTGRVSHLYVSWCASSGWSAVRMPQSKTHSHRAFHLKPDQPLKKFFWRDYVITCTFKILSNFNMSKYWNDNIGRTCNIKMKKKKL